MIKCKTEIILTIITTFFILSPFTSISENSEHIWCCRYCGEVEELSVKPLSGKCAARNAPHGWEDLGEKGKHRFICKKCGARVFIKNYPRLTGCPKGSSHSWEQN